MTPLAALILLAFFLLPLLSPARPTTRQIAPTRKDADLVFGAAFSLALLSAILGSFAWLATGRSLTQLFTSLHRISAALIAFVQRLSEVPISSLVERAAAALNAIVANRANRPRRGGPTAPVATVLRGRVQSERRGRLGGAQINDGPPAFTSST